jgi:hypothetical protein
MPLFGLSALVYVVTLLFVMVNDKSDSDGDYSKFVT